MTDQGIAYIQSLEAELAPEIDKILQHRFLMRIKDQNLNKRQLRYFCEQYYLYAFSFPAFLAACAANAPSDHTRLSLIENLWEEHGEGDLNLSHRTLYLRWAESLGLRQEDLDQAEKLITTRVCVENMLYICKDEPFLTSVGALGPGCEYFTNAEYKLIEQGLLGYDFQTAEDVNFWTVHISLDEHHYAEMVEPLQSLLVEDDHREQLRRGALRAVELELLFWEGLEINLPKN